MEIKDQSLIKNKTHKNHHDLILVLNQIDQSLHPVRLKVLKKLIISAF